MSEHARLSPSGAHRWMRCPGSLGEEEKLPRGESSAYADEGTAAHELAEKTLEAKAEKTEIFKGQLAENGYEFTQDMCDQTQKYVDTIYGYAEGNYLFVEEKVDFSSYVNYPDSFGTSDALIITRDCKEIQIHDLKYGMGVKVGAEENEQMMLYALGGLAKHDLMGTIEHVRMVIHQPRLNHLDEWICTVEDLYAFAEKAKEAAVEAINYADNEEGGDDLFRPDEKACRWCRAKAHCPALVNYVAETIDVKFEDLTTEKGQEAIKEKIEASKNLSNEELSAIMPSLDLIVDWTKTIRGRVEAELLQGNEVPDYKLVEGKRGARRWIDKKEAEEKLKAMRLKKDEMYSMNVISPTQAEKLLKKNSVRRWNTLQDFITQSGGKPSVAHVSDKRPAVDLSPKFEDLSTQVDDLV